MGRLPGAAPAMGVLRGAAPVMGVLRGAAPVIPVLPGAVPVMGSLPGGGPTGGAAAPRGAMDHGITGQVPRGTIGRDGRDSPGQRRGTVNSLWQNPRGVRRAMHPA